MQKHVNCGAFGSVDKITCHIYNSSYYSTCFKKLLVRDKRSDAVTSELHSLIF